MGGAATFFLTALVLISVYVSPLLALEPSSKRECAVCHVMWMEDFKSGVETVIPWINTNVLMKNTFGVVSSEDMCYSCHDGFVVDSRAVWTGKRHTVFKKPTDKVRIDERKFPLSVKGEIYCGTCHSIHSESSDEIVSFKVFLRMDNRNSEMCRACHTGYDAGPSKGFHTTMKEVKGGFPESLFAAGLRPAANRKDVICSSCHRVHGTPREDLVPSVAGLTDFCGVCHKANTGRGPEGARLLAHRMGAEMKDIKPTEELKKAGAKFDDNRLGCLSCHKLHQGKAADILVMDNPDSELCLQCHDKMKVVRETPHNLAKTGKDLKTAKDKTVGDVGTCSFCHGSHGWTRTISGNEALAKEVCSSCHGTDRKVTKIEIKGPYSHSVGKGLEKIAKGVKIDLPLFTDNHTAGDKVYCSTCHDAHVPGKGAIDDRGLVKTKFLRAENKIALCEKCHVNEKLVRGTGHDAAIFEKKYENINKEGVQVSGLCGACHFVHSGPKPIGFAGLPPDRKYPEEIARNAANLYCLSCHEEGRSGEKKLTGRITHPLGGKPKEAEGDLKDKEVVCASCHDPHRWSPTVAAYGLGKNVDGDLTNSFLRADNSKGKLCEVCHKTEYKVFSSRHDVSEKEKKGVCEFCHVTHNAKGKKLWTRDLTKAFLDEKEQSRACLECHRKEAPGEKAIVKLFRHPDNLLLVNLPLLAKYGLPRDDKSLDMEINCVTCHDPHVWSKTAVEGAAGKEISSKTAFLKAEDPANTACVPCHKIETRYKYQFYHKEKARTKDNPYYDPSNLIESLKKFKKKRYEE